MQDPTLFQSIRSQGFPEQQEQVIKCPRCDSTNTKFCYYNNYNLSQPRHFCKNCKRYWTKGGTLRNIPIGGGSRKNTKRSSSSSSSKRSPATSSSPPTASTAAGSSDPTRIQTDPISGSFKSSLLSSSSASFSSSGDVGIVMEGVNRNGLVLEMAKGGDFDGNLGSSGEEGVVEMHRNDGGDLSCWNSGNEWSNLAMYTTTPGSRFR